MSRYWESLPVVFHTLSNFFIFIAYIYLIHLQAHKADFRKTVGVLDRIEIQAGEPQESKYQESISNDDQ